MKTKKPFREPLSAGMMYAGWLHNRVGASLAGRFPSAILAFPDGASIWELESPDCHIMYDPHTDRCYTVTTDGCGGREPLVAVNDALNQYHPEEL